MPENAFLGVWGAVTLLAFVSGAVSLWLHFKTGSLHELTSQIRSVTGDMAELFDLFEKWTKRDRVRRLRDGREAAGAEAAQAVVPQPGTPAYKDYLRRKARGEIQ